MRRPIFGNGIPRNILNGAPVTVLDTTALDPKQTYALTLYLWAYGPFVVGPPPPPGQLLVSVTTNGGTPIPLGTWAGAPLPPPDTNIKPIKILDQYTVRGNQQVVLSNPIVGSAFCFVWGYFEQTGECEQNKPFRGLQPSTPVAPFSYQPAAYNIVAPGSNIEVIHQLTTAYIDEVTLDVWGPLGDASGSYAAIVIGGGGVPLPVTTSPAAYRLFDGIPMRAADSTEIDIKLVSALTTPAFTLGGAYGSFYRY